MQTMYGMCRAQAPEPFSFMRWQAAIECVQIWRSPYQLGRCVSSILIKADNDEDGGGGGGADDDDW